MKYDLALKSSLNTPKLSLINQVSASSFLTLPTIPPVIFLNMGIPALAISVGHFFSRSPGILVTFQVICSTDNFKRVKNENIAYP